MDIASYKLIDKVLTNRLNKIPNNFITGANLGW